VNRQAWWTFWSGFAAGVATFAVFLSIIAIIVDSARGTERSPDDWFALVVTIERDVAQADAEQRKLPNIDAEDRRFIRKMTNELAVSADARPTVAQGVWLIKIREWLDAGKK
jgi:hypothetical protein